MHRETKPRITTPLLGFIGFLALWQGIAFWGHYPAFILPTPEAVATRLVEVVADGSLWRHVEVTLGEVLGGLGLGVAVATSLGYVLAHSPTAERLLTPYLVASQSVPVVAIAPLLIIWFGSGMLSKVLICALIVFFPILVNTTVGIRAVEREWHDLMRSLEASRWQMISLLEVPAALPVLIGGLKVGATLAVIGAVVGEFVASDRGLGYMLKQGQQMYDTPLIFVGVGVLAAMAQSLYGCVALAERWLLRWKLTAPLAS